MGPVRRNSVTPPVTATAISQSDKDHATAPQRRRYSWMYAFLSKKLWSCATSAGGHRRTVATQLMSLYLVHPVWMLSHANCHSLSARLASPCPHDTAASATCMSVYPWRFLMIFSMILIAFL